MLASSPSPPRNRRDLESIRVADRPGVGGSYQFHRHRVVAQHRDQLPQLMKHVAAMWAKPKDGPSVLGRQLGHRKMLVKPLAELFKPPLRSRVKGVGVLDVAREVAGRVSSDAVSISIWASESAFFDPTPRSSVTGSLASCRSRRLTATRPRPGTGRAVGRRGAPRPRSRDGAH